jgi:hypothetical protein
MIRKGSFAKPAVIVQDYSESVSFNRRLYFTIPPGLSLMPRAGLITAGP